MRGPTNMRQTRRKHAANSRQRNPGKHATTHVKGLAQTCGKQSAKQNPTNMWQTCRKHAANMRQYEKRTQKNDKHAANVPLTCRKHAANSHERKKPATMRQTCDKHAANMRQYEKRRKEPHRNPANMRQTSANMPQTAMGAKNRQTCRKQPCIRKHAANMRQTCGKHAATTQERLEQTAM